MNEQKLDDMGFLNYAGLLSKPIKILVSDSRPLSFKELVPYVIDASTGTKTGVHGTNCCMVIKMVSDYTGIPVEIHYIDDRTKAVDYAKTNGINVISQSLGFQWTDAYKAKVREWGGVIVNSAGNEGDRETKVPNDYGIAVSTLFDSDNSGAFITGHSGWVLPQTIQGIDNIFTHTSSATPVIAFAVALAIELYGYNFNQVKEWLIKNSNTNHHMLEQGERFFSMGPIETGKTIEMFIGGETYVNGKLVKLDVPAQIINGRTLVPFRFIGEELGCIVSYTVDSSNKVKSVKLVKL